MRAAVRHAGTSAAPGADWSTRLKWVGGMLALVLALPPAIYAVLAWRQAGFLKITWYSPYEELFAAFESGDPGLILSSAVISVNMTSGDLLANMYQLTVEQLLLSLGLATVVGLAIEAQVRLMKVCATGTVGGSTAAAGSGLAATVAASSTGIMGCCGAGAGLAGGVLALTGVGSATAAQIAEISPYVQLALIAAFAFAYVRFRRRLNALGGA